MVTKTRPPYKSLLKEEAKPGLDEAAKKVWTDFVNWKEIKKKEFAETRKKFQN